MEIPQKQRQHYTFVSLKFKNVIQNKKKTKNKVKCKQAEVFATIARV